MKRSFVHIRPFIVFATFCLFVFGTVTGQDERVPIDSSNVESVSLLETFSGHSGWGRAVAFSPTEPILASTADDGVIIFWNLETGEPIIELTEHSSSVLDIVFSSDGTKLISGDYEGNAIVWDTETYEILNSLEGGHFDAIYSVGFNFDASFAFTGGGGQDLTLVIWDLAASDEYYGSQSQSGGVDGIAYATNENGQDFLATGLWSGLAGIDTINSDGELDNLHVVNHGETIVQVAFSPDVSILATAGKDSVARLWNVETGRQIVELRGHRREVLGVVFSPDGSLVATCSLDQTVKIWDVETGDLLATLQHEAGLIDVDFNADGTLIATAGNDGNVYVWGIPTE